MNFINLNNEKMKFNNNVEKSFIMKKIRRYYKYINLLNNFLTYIKRKNFILINIINDENKINVFRILIIFDLSLIYIYYKHFIIFNIFFNFQIKFYNVEDF